MSTIWTAATILLVWLAVSIPAGMFFGALLAERAKDYPSVENNEQK